MARTQRVENLKKNFMQYHQAGYSIPEIAAEFNAENPVVMQLKNGENVVAVVSGYVANVAKAIGADIKVTGFTRLAKGEGIEKKVDDFAAEVAAQANA